MTWRRTLRPERTPRSELQVTNGCGNPLQLMDTHWPDEKGGTRTILGDLPVLLVST